MSLRALQVRLAMGIIVVLLSSSGCRSLPWGELPALHPSPKGNVPDAVVEFTSLGKRHNRELAKSQGRNQGLESARVAHHQRGEQIHRVKTNSDHKIRKTVAREPASVIPVAARLGLPTEAPSKTVMPETLPQPTGNPTALQPAAQPNMIDFKSALQTAVGQNPRVAIAAARIDEAFARLQSANVLWLPSIRAGVSVNKHDGSIQEVAGPVFDVNRSALNSGLGAAAVGAGSPAIPGIFARFHTADAVFQPKIASANLAARQTASAAVNNDLLLDTATAYIDLLAAVQQQAIARETTEKTTVLVRITSAFAESGQGNQADADRAEVELALRRNESLKAVEEILVASARLAELLRLDPAAPLLPAEPAITEIELVQTDCAVQELVATGLANRPELIESRHLVDEAIQGMKREKYSPFLPSLLLGFSYSGFGGSPGSSIDNFRDRLDLDAAAFWEIRNLGFGEKAARNQARAKMNEKKMREVLLMDKIASEIAQAFAQVNARRQQIVVAQSGIAAAETSYKHNLDRIRNGKGLPLELLQSIQALDQMRRAYLRAVVDFNKAQFELHRAIGWPIN